MTLLAAFHILVSVLLIALVLLQDPKGGTGGLFGGGSSSSVFGATGATTFLNKMTKWVAIFFAVTSVALTYGTRRQSGSVTDEYVPAPAVEAPQTQDATPADETPAAPQGSQQ